MIAKVIVAHPERQYSDQLAVALADRDMLSHFYHGGRLPQSTANEIPKTLRTWLGLATIGRRLVLPLVPADSSSRIYHAFMDAFDRVIGLILTYTPCDAVICYETSALHTFRAAKKKGVTCILDAASMHHSWVYRWVPEEHADAVAQRKFEELRLADYIITCSDLARLSYIDAGFPAERVRAVQLGADIAKFKLQNNVRADDTVRFCYAGFLGMRKGIDILFEAFTRLRNAGSNAELALAGGTGGHPLSFADELATVARIHGRISHEQLAQFFASQDVFILPSRFDSFGMVVTEAMACGLPVIVSENVGAKDMVSEGVNGWIIPVNDAGALAERMAWCAANPQAVRSMRPAARAAAEARGWDAYRREVADAITHFLGERPRTSASHQSTI